MVILQTTKLLSHLLFFVLFVLSLACHWIGSVRQYHLFSLSFHGTGTSLIHPLAMYLNGRVK